MERCIHCLTEEGVTRDHVFPKAWYPSETPHTIQRPTAPSCPRCNKEFGRLEDSLLGKLGLCLDPGLRSSAGIPQKALRAVGIGVQGLDPRELNVRTGRKRKLFREMANYTAEGDRKVVLPGFEPHPDFAATDQLAVLVSNDDLKAVCEKVIRGLEYFLAERYIEPPYELSGYFLDESGRLQMEDFFRNAAMYGLPGLQVRRAAMQEDSLQVIYQLRIWDKWQVYGSIVDPSTLSPKSSDTASAI